MAGRILAFTLILALVSASLLLVPIVAPAADTGAQTGAGVPAPGIDGLKQAVTGYVAASGEGVSASDVVSFLDDYDAGISANPAFDTGYVFNEAQTWLISATALTSSKFVVAYADNGNGDRGTAIVGTVAGSAVTYGAEYVFNAGITYDISATALTNNKIAVAYEDADNSFYGTAVVGTVAGTVISFGTEYVFNAAATAQNSITALSDTVFAIAYDDNGTGFGTGVIGTVTGSNIAYGSGSVFNNSGSDHISATALTASKFVVAYIDNGNSNYGTAAIGLVAGGNITFGLEYVFNNATTYFTSAAALSDSKFAVAYCDAGNSFYGTAVVGNVTGMVIAFGSEYVFGPEETRNLTICALSGDRLAVFYAVTVATLGKAKIGDVSSSVIAFGSEYAFDVNVSYLSITALSEGKFAAAYQDWSHGSRGTVNIGGMGATVRTDPATDVTATSFTLNGNITDVESGDCDQRGFQYRTPGYPYWQEWYESDGPYGTGAYTLSISEVDPGTTFEFRARVHNASGWANGETLTVTTDTAYYFYFAEGHTGDGFQEYLCLGQPADAPLDVEVTFLFGGGGTQVEDYTVPAQSRFTVDVNQAVGEGKDVSVVCKADSPFIAERPMYFIYGPGWTGGHDAVGAPSPSTTWYFAEGYTGPGFDEYICVLNPGADDADLTFRFQTSGDEIVVEDKTVPAHSRQTFLANQLLGGSYEASLMLESSQPVVAERPIYFNYTGYGAPDWNGGHCVMGSTSLASDYFFAEGTTRPGFDEYLTIQNPNGEEITVDAVYQLGPGQGGPLEASYTVPAEGRTTVYVNAPAPTGVGPGVDVSVHLTCTEDFLAERPMYFNYSGMGYHAWTGGHCVIGATRSAWEWFFAEGYTGEGFEEWICIQNPGDKTAEVTITYFPEGGGEPIVCPQPDVAAGTRYTAYVNGPDNAGPDRAISAMVTSDEPVICERPMYFDFFGITGGHDVVGFVP